VFYRGFSTTGASGYGRTEVSTVATAKANLAEMENTIAVLRKLLAEAESKAAICRSLVEVAERNAARDTARDAHNETHRPLNHLSGSSFNSYDLIQEVLKWLNNHGAIGEWHWVHSMCVDMDAYNRWTKTVVHATLEEMVGKGFVELKGQQIKLVPQAEPELVGPGPEAF
jgi:hypothetical protein